MGWLGGFSPECAQPQAGQERGAAGQERGAAGRERGAALARGGARVHGDELPASPTLPQKQSLHTVLGGLMLLRFLKIAEAGQEGRRRETEDMC